MQINTQSGKELTREQIRQILSPIRGAFSVVAQRAKVTRTTVHLVINAKAESANVWQHARELAMEEVTKVSQILKG